MRLSYIKKSQFLAQTFSYSQISIFVYEFNEYYFIVIVYYIIYVNTDPISIVTIYFYTNLLIR